MIGLPKLAIRLHAKNAKEKKLQSKPDRIVRTFQISGSESREEIFQVSGSLKNRVSIMYIPLRVCIDMYRSPGFPFRCDQSPSFEGQI